MIPEMHKTTKNRLMNFLKAKFKKLIIITEELISENKVNNKSGCKLQVASYKLQVTSYKLQVTSYKLQVTSCRLQVAGCMTGSPII